MQSVTSLVLAGLVNFIEVLNYVKFDKITFTET